MSNLFIKFDTPSPYQGYYSRISGDTIFQTYDFRRNFPY